MKTIIFALYMLFVANAFAGTVTLEWDASTGVDGYKVYVDGKHDAAATITGTTSKSTVVPGAHNFNVTAYNARAESVFSNTVTTPAIATAPANFRYSISGNNAVFGWDAVSSATEYRLYVNGVLTKVPAGTVTATMPISTGASAAYVTAYNGWGESPASNTLTILSIPASPANLRATVVVSVTVVMP
jgi:uncharacterized protein YxeA